MVTNEARRLRSFRQKLKMSQQLFAKELEITQPELSKFERGLREIPPRIITRLYKKYKYSYEWHYNGVGKVILNEKEKPTLITDLKNIKDEIKGIQFKMEKMEKTLMQVLTDFYDFRNNQGHGRDMAGTKNN